MSQKLVAKPAPLSLKPLGFLQKVVGFGGMSSVKKREGTSRRVVKIRYELASTVVEAGLHVGRVLGVPERMLLLLLLRQRRGKMSPGWRVLSAFGERL